MAFLELRCSKCGGTLKEKGNVFECGYCHATYLSDQIEKEKAALSALLDEQKQEQLANRRHMLWDAIHAEYIDSELIIDLCRSVRKLKPEDFEARFFEVANSGSGRDLNKFIDSIDVKNAEENFWVEEIVKFTIKSLRAENILSINDLIERAYKSTDLEKYEKYATHVSDEAKKVEGGIYEPELPRDVFVMYSSKDFKKVKELVYTLEESGLKCFVAMRNLQHGRGAVANYQRALETAMDNCKVVVFLSSKNSRSITCDAVKVEMPYLKRKDIENAPYEYRQHYDKMPQKYKKPRVEYRLDNEKAGGGDMLVKEFFGELEFAYSAEEVLNRVVRALTAGVEEKPQEKICIACGAKNPLQTKFCMECGGREFASTEAEYERKKHDKDKEAIERAERENAALLARLKAMEEAQKKAEEESKKRQSEAVIKAQEMEAQRKVEEAEKANQALLERLKKLEEAQKKETEKKALAAEEEAKKRAEEAEKANQELLERLKKLEEAQKKTSVAAVSAEKKTAEKSAGRTEKKEEESNRKTEAVKAEVGDTVTFGSYYQSENGGKQPVEWTVLKKEGSKALLISKFVLAYKPYYNYKVDTTWESSSIRKWLNGEFLNEAFTPIERKKIQRTNVVTLDNASRKTQGGNPTNDRIFLLSIEEAEEYFSSDNKRKCKPTAYAVWKHANKHSSGYGSWWLRSPGYSQDYAAYVSFDGDVINFGAAVYNTSAGSTTAFGETIYESSMGVRPAFWMNLGAESNGFEEAEEKTTEEKTTEKKTTEKSVVEKKPLDPIARDKEKGEKIWQEMQTLKIEKAAGFASNGYTHGSATFGGYPQSSTMLPTSKYKKDADERGYYAWDLGKFEYYENEYALHYKVEPIHWEILEDKDGVLTLLSTDVLDARICNLRKVNFEKTELYKWLNGEFLHKAFTKEAQEWIVGKEGAKVTLLSFEQTKQMLPYWRRKKVTEYAEAKGCAKKEGGYGSWFLSTPDENNYGGSSMKGVHDNGGDAAFLYKNVYGVVPVIRVYKDEAAKNAAKNSVQTTAQKTSVEVKKTADVAPMVETSAKKTATTAAKGANTAKYFSVCVGDRDNKSSDFLETVKELAGITATAAQKLISDGQPLKRGLTEADAQAYVELLGEFGSKIEIVPDTRPLSVIEAERKKEAETASTVAKATAKPVASPAQKPAATPQVKDFGPAFEVKDTVLIKYKGAGGNVVIPPGITKIGSEAFKMAKEMSSVKIPDSVTMIDSFAFQFCGKLTEVTIPNSVTEIGSAAFQYCGRLAKVSIPDSVKRMGMYQFAGCGELKEVTVGANNPGYRSIDGNLYTKDGKTLLYYAKGKPASSFTLPNSVEKIEQYAFAGCASLTEIVLPSGLTTIGNYAFVDCYMLRTIVIPTSVKTVGAQSFQGCSALKGDPVQTWQAAKKKAETESAKAVEANYPYVCVRVTDKGKSIFDTAGMIRYVADCSFEESYNIVKNKEIFARGLTKEEAKKYVAELEKLGAKGAVETDKRTAATVEAERKTWKKQVDERILDGRKETQRLQQVKQTEEDRRNHEVSKPFSETEQQALKNFTRGEVLKCGPKTAFFGVFPQHKAAGVPSDLKTNPNAYEAFKGEYYIVEPIKWRILEETDKELYLFSDRGLDCMAYSLKSNVYENSAIRAWLNKDFLNRAFTVAEREKLVADSLGDKVTLIARDELMDKRLGFAAKQPKESDDSRVVWASEYSRAKGAAHALYWTKTAYKEGSGEWSNSTWVYMVNRHGEIGANGVENQKDHSIVPVIRVSKVAPMSQTKAKATVLASPSNTAKTSVKAKALTLKEQADMRFAQGMALYNQRKYTDALKILQEDPLLKTHGEALYMVGYCYELGLGRLKDLRRATEFYQDAKRNGYQKAEDGVLRIRRGRRAEGVCQYCGGAFKGLFTKTCSYCGIKKDY